MKRTLWAVAALIATWAAVAQTQTFTASDGAVITYTPAPAVVVPPPIVIGGGTSATPPPTAGMFTVYDNGIENWQGTYVSPAPGATVVLTDTTCKPSGATMAALFSGNGNDYPVLDFYANNPPQSWSLANYTSISFVLKPSAVVPITLQFIPEHDESSVLPIITLGSAAAYGPAPKAGVWASYTIPLAALGIPFKNGTPPLPDYNVYKFGFQIGQAKSKATVCLDNITLQ